jgi:hypothetical protein
MLRIARLDLRLALAMARRISPFSSSSDIRCVWLQRGVVEQIGLLIISLNSRIGLDI